MIGNLLTGKFALGLVTGLLVVGLPLAPHALQSATSSPSGTNYPAQKTTIAGSSLEVMTAPLTQGSKSEEHVLLATTTRTATTEDLALQVTAECALWTDVSVTGNSQSQAVATVKVWIEVDGHPVAVSNDEPSGADQGKVVFCNRDYKFAITNHDDQNSTFAEYLRSREANAFNWVVINAGNGIHQIVVKCQLEVQVTGAGMAEAAVGKRTLISEPVHLSNDATLSSGTA